MSAGTQTSQFAVYTHYSSSGNFYTTPQSSTAGTVPDGQYYLAKMLHAFADLLEAMVK